MTTVPTWIKDSIFYQIFPDRFARSGLVEQPENLEPWGAPPTVRGFKGGDLLGILQHLDYLEELGITALYFNPIFQSAANHRYHTHDYFRVDPLLGGNPAFQSFMQGARQRGFRVVLDGVFNHASRGFLPFNSLMENGAQSPYLNWFIVHGFPLNAFDAQKPANYAAWWDNRELPKLNTDNPDVREFIYRVAEHWLHQGIDGWRLDVPLEIETPGFWETFRQRVRAVNPEAYILAEIWHEAQPWLQGEHFDAVMNYGFNRACYGFFGGQALDVTAEPGGFKLQRLSAEGFAEAVHRLLRLYDWEVTLAQYNLLSSHDEPRFLTLVGGDRRRLWLATLFQMTFPGAPSVYYGDEIGMVGGPDPDCRRAFPWDREVWDAALLASFRRAIALRHEHAVLRTGAYTTLYARGQTYACARHDAGSAVIAAFNLGSRPAKLVLDLAHPSSETIPAAEAGGVLPAGATLREVWAQPAHSPEINDGKLTVTLPPMDARVFVTP